MPLHEPLVQDQTSRLALPILLLGQTKCLESLFRVSMLSTCKVQMVDIARLVLKQTVYIVMIEMILSLVNVLPFA